MFNFVWRTKQAFRKVKREYEELRSNVNEWIVFLDGRGSELEKRLDKIEDRLDRMEETMFKILSLR